ncbi:GIY-YIG nuclease family protein [Micromonospora sp. NPDC048169]|uniref:GIY-YIG nuclease family protein n=1 Tax=Micromonospora sp. NPDC048169 TaxID=3154711 RepID=UPI0033C48EF6
MGRKHRPHPDDFSGHQCSWFMCTAMISNRFHRAGIMICQEHALQTWATVEQMNASGPPIREEPKPKPVPNWDNFEGYVYYIRIADLVKIGHTKNLDRRLATYPPGMEILKIRYGSRALEHQEHIRFSEHLNHGREWFQANERVLQLVSEVNGLDIEDHLEPEDYQRRQHTPQIVRHRRVNSERAGHGH